jgi:transposase InsO family protein
MIVRQKPTVVCVSLVVCLPQPTISCVWRLFASPEWILSELESGGPVGALRRRTAWGPYPRSAWWIATKPPASVHCDYTDLPKANGIEISMCDKGNPWDNAACESFLKTLKYEEVLRNEYRDLADARASIREFLEKVYNQKRLHSALDYVPPAEFEVSQKDAATRQLTL